jgi:putative phosphonate metabolism protein
MRGLFPESGTTMGDWRRHAIYFAPRPDHPLAAFGADWLGWDPAAGRPRQGLALAGLPRRREDLVAAPARYGFHGTLEPPFRLAPGRAVAELDAAAAVLAARHAAFPLRLRLDAVDGFLALVADPPLPALAAIADDCVTGLDAFRAPPDPAELARRRAAGLDAVEAAHLATWGYPYVLDRFVFHMTLTGRLHPAEVPPVRRALDRALAPVLAAPLAFETICRFSEAADGRFHLVRRFPLAGAPEARGRPGAPRAW